MEYQKLSNPQNERICLKFLFVGDYAVGKTAIVKRYINKEFSSTYRITYGAEFSTKQILWKNETLVSLQLWDVAGQERYGYISSVYYRNAVGCFIVFDISKYETFESVTRWFETLNEKVFIDNDEKIPIILLANKCDTRPHTVSDEQISKLCKKIGLHRWYKTSAKLDLNIDEAINSLIQKSLEVWCKINEDNRKDCIVLDKKKPATKCCYR